MSRIGFGPIFLISSAGLLTSAVIFHLQQIFKIDISLELMANIGGGASSSMQIELGPIVLVAVTIFFTVWVITSLTKPQRFRRFHLHIRLVSLIIVLTFFVSLTFDSVFWFLGKTGIYDIVQLMATGLLVCLALPILYLQKAETFELDNDSVETVSRTMDASANDGFTISVSIQLLLIIFIYAAGIQSVNVLDLLFAILYIQVLTYLISILYRGWKIKHSAREDKIIEDTKV